MVNMFVSNQLSKLMKSRGPSRGNRHRDSNRAACSNQASKQDKLGIDREPKAKATKEKATMLIREALKLAVDEKVWSFAKNGSVNLEREMIMQKQRDSDKVQMVGISSVMNNGVLTIRSRARLNKFLLRFCVGKCVEFGPRLLAQNC